MFELSSDEPGVRYECRRGDGTYDEWRPCASGQPVSGLGPRVDIRAVDAVGNVDWSPAEWGNGTYGVDTKRLDRRRARPRGRPHRADRRARRPSAASTARRSGAARRTSSAATAPGATPPAAAHRPVRRGRERRRRPRVHDQGAGHGADRRRSSTAPARTDARAARGSRGPARPPTGSFVCSVDGAVAQPCTSPLTLCRARRWARTPCASAGAGRPGSTEYFGDSTRRSSRWRVTGAGPMPAPTAAASVAGARGRHGAAPLRRCRRGRTSPPCRGRGSRPATSSCRFTADQAGVDVRVPGRPGRRGRRARARCG